jgi:hypothetical protein
MPEHAKPIAYYDHPFFGKWPAITENEFGSGTLLYEGYFSFRQTADGRETAKPLKTRAQAFLMSVAQMGHETRRPPSADYSVFDSTIYRNLGAKWHFP